MNICLNTKFLFIITSQKKVEDRFFYDAEHYIKAILEKGGSTDNIIVATDSSSTMVCAKCPAMQGVIFISSEQVLSMITALNCDNLIILADCHGSLFGIDSPQPIGSYALTEAIKNNKSVMNVIVLFGQCFSGIYNGVDLRDDDKNIVYIGATGFDSSFSYKLPTTTWFTNISLMAFRNWIIKPIDIDGDGAFTVMDLYKYIAWFTTSIVHELEKIYTSLFIDAKVKQELAKKFQEKSPDMMEQLKKEAVEVLGNYTIPHQVPWILNAFSAQRIIFE